MTTFLLIHGGGDTGWAWHRVQAALESRGHRVFAPDLPGDDDSLTLDDYAEAAVADIEEGTSLVVVGHSFGGFTAPLVAALRPVEQIVFLAGMVPRPGESPEEWWGNTGSAEAVTAQAAVDGGLTGNSDPFISFYHDVPRVLAEEAMSRERAHPSAAAMSTPWPRDALPDVLAAFLLCRDDRFFPAAFMRRMVRGRLGIEPEEIPGSHCAPLSHPEEVADALERVSERRE
ncbi:alpha/beta hydrolase [Microbacterium sp. LTA6]|uniref:alpha/beta fold hydrolase n=1 Tax=Microbacterium sp. LTA6 TaxID=3129771 RepID=UPI0032519F2A